MAAECFYARNNQQQGPVTWEALQAMAAAGQLQRGDLVWKPGMGNWQPAGEVAGLLPAAPVAPLPITTVAPGIAVEGPVPELADEVRDLQRRRFRL